MNTSPNRKRLRLKNQDYSKPNYYFVTICTHNRLELFGTPHQLNVCGQIAEEELLRIPLHYESVRIDRYVIMPNHIHAIVVIGCDGGAERSRPFPTLDTIIGLYKSGVSKRIHQSINVEKIWQKSYYDHILRNRYDYYHCVQYITDNPRNWELDELFTHEQELPRETP